jgi:hypothetical protein
MFDATFAATLLFLLRGDHEETPQAFFNDMQVKGNESVPSQIEIKVEGDEENNGTYVVVAGRKIFISDGNWHPQFFMPDPKAYKLNDIFYIDVLSLYSVDVQRPRTNLKYPLAVQNATGVAFVNVNSTWNFVGIYQIENTL